MMRCLSDNKMNKYKLKKRNTIQLLFLPEQTDLHPALLGSHSGLCRYEGLTERVVWRLTFHQPRHLCPPHLRPLHCLRRLHHHYLQSRYCCEDILQILHFTLKFSQKQKHVFVLTEHGCDRPSIGTWSRWWELQGQCVKTIQDVLQPFLFLLFSLFIVPNWSQLVGLGANGKHTFYKIICLNN